MDPCSAGDLRQLAQIPLRSPDDFVLVWQTVGPGFLDGPPPEAKARTQPPVFEFETRSSKLSVDGTVQVGKVCPDIVRDTKFRQDK